MIRILDKQIFKMVYLMSILMDENVLALLLVLIGAAVAYFMFIREPARPKYTGPTLSSATSGRVLPTSSNRSSSSNASSKSKQKQSNDGPQLKVFYGSQTGTAEEFAHIVSGEGKRAGFNVEVIDMEEYEPSDLADETGLCVFMIATYGEGEPTDNSKDFFDWLEEEDKDSTEFERIKYTVFGLGNKTYEHYNSMGKKCDSRLSELGGQRVYPLGLGDDDDALEDDFNKWKANLWSTVCPLFNLSFDSSLKDKHEPRHRLVTDADKLALHKPLTALFSDPNRPFDAKNPYSATIVEMRELHSEQSDRSCSHIELDVGRHLTYQPGDHVGIYPENEATLVSRLVDRLGVQADQVIALEPIAEDKGSGLHSSTGRAGFWLGPCTVAVCLARFCDVLTAPRQNALAALAQYCADAGDQQQMEKLGSDADAYKHEIRDKHVSWLELLTRFPSLQPPLGHFLELLPRLAPRYYSISSSQQLVPGRVHVTAVLTQFTTPTGRQHTGVCTGWFQRLKPSVAGSSSSGGGARSPPTVQCFIRSSHFKLPRLPSTPLVMIGPGTGIAPFRGFLQHRLYLQQQAEKKGDKQFKLGPAVLYFGCRSRDVDFLYQQELLEYVRANNLSNLHLAFSREGSSKVYVQHLMSAEENELELYELLGPAKKGSVYVCGDARLMAKDVHDALVQCFRRLGQLKSDKEAEDKLAQLTKQNRYHKDVWF